MHTPSIPPPPPPVHARTAVVEVRAGDSSGVIRLDRENRSTEHLRPDLLHLLPQCLTDTVRTNKHEQRQIEKERQAPGPPPCGSTHLALVSLVHGALHHTPAQSFAASLVTLSFFLFLRCVCACVCARVCVRVYARACAAEGSTWVFLM